MDFFACYWGESGIILRAFLGESRLLCTFLGENGPFWPKLWTILDTFGPWRGGVLSHPSHPLATGLLLPPPPPPEKLPLCRCQNFLKHKETKSKLMLKLLLKIWCGDRLKFKLGNISELIDSWVNKHLSFVVFVIGNNSTWNCYPYSLSTPWLYTRWTNADSSHTLRTPLWQSQLESNYCSTLLIKSSSKNTL